VSLSHSQPGAGRTQRGARLATARSGSACAGCDNLRTLLCRLSQPHQSGLVRVGLDGYELASGGNGRRGRSCGRVGAGVLPLLLAAGPRRRYAGHDARNGGAGSENSVRHLLVPWSARSRSAFARLDC